MPSPLTNPPIVLANLLIRLRLPLILVSGVLLTCLSYLGAFALRFDFYFPQYFTVQHMWFPLAVLLLWRRAAYIYWSLNQGHWRYLSTADMVRICKAHAVSSAFFAGSIAFFHITAFPRSIFILELLLSVFFAGGMRLIVRLFAERWLMAPGIEQKQIIVLGAGDSGHLVVKYLQSHKRFGCQPVLVLDDSERLIGSSVHGVPVAGALRELSYWLGRYTRVAAVLLAIPSLSRHRRQELETVCRQLGVPLRKLQSFEDIAAAARQRPEEPSIEEMLEKEIAVEHEDEIRYALAGKRVLITGAGGSIGSELARQVLSFHPAAVTLLDHSEYNLFRAEQEFSANWHDTLKSFVLATITDARRLKLIFAEAAPDIVFHAAAYKHVPLVEFNCYQALQNNVAGTRNVLDACVSAGVEKLVLISTDKAVDPSSLMGCSKRLAEMLVAEYGSMAGLRRLRTAVVRFGNVINSSGSVIPLFKEQLLSGGPLTVTHPEMERFFMSIREAVRLVLTAGILGDQGKIYVLDMGQPIKIIDLARKMLGLYGRRDIPIVFTGMRPGEKLKEELTADWEHTVPTRFAKVREIRHSLSAREPVVSSWLARFEKEAAGLKDSEVSESMYCFLQEADGYADGGQKIGNLGS